MIDSEIEITFCMGSSCFSRGNKKTLQAVQKYLGNMGLSAKISIVGSHCLDKCVHGPIIKINNIRYTQVDEFNVIGFIESFLETHLDK
ncbi:MAG TPA: hypothetical protein DCM62_03735 [Bacteroidales bacterium]|nr:hypothetical protein [Bacteroidales bacterium]